MQKQDPVRGLILSGGGARGAYQVGVLAAAGLVALDTMIDRLAAQDGGTLSPEELVGLIFAIFVITVAAAEVGLALAIILRLFRSKGSVNLDEVNLMKW